MQQQLIVEQCNAGLPAALHLDALALNELTAYNWPGNIRQLHNVLARLACRANPTQPITAREVRLEISRFQELDDDMIILPYSCSTLFPGESLEDFTSRIRIAVIEGVKARLSGNMNRTAKRLGVDRSSLHRISQRLNTLNETKVGRKDSIQIAA